MATIGNTVLTLVDIAKRTDPNGKVAVIAELLAQTNEMLMDMPWKMGNLEVGHRMSVRTGLPTVYWRTLNMGVPTSKSKAAQVDEQTGMLEAWSEVDIDVTKLNGNVAETRLSEAMAFLEAMNQEMQGTMIYGNGSISPEEFNGLAIRYSSLSAGNATNIIDAGGVGSDNTSMWLVGWGEQTVFGIFPKGTEAGLVHKDWGEQVVATAGTPPGGSRMGVFNEQWQWKAGLAIKDWRFVVRGANIDVSNLVAESSAADLIKTMIKMWHRLPNKRMGRPVFYVNRTVFQMLDIQARNAVSSGGQLSYSVVNGMEILNFRGAPIRTVDQILDTEARVV